MVLANFLDPVVISKMISEIGVPAAFAIFMFFLVVYFSKQHRSERGEWRDMMAIENQLTRNALKELRDGLGQLAESVAFLDGKMGMPKKKKKRKK